MGMQQIVMPAMYKRYAKGEIKEGLVLFCDSHSGHMPFSMRRIYDEVEKLSQDEQSHIRIEKCITDFSSMGVAGMLRWINSFMKLYGAAQYVFLCDNFLPVSSCEKRPETMVIQLWHSGGMFKKFGYDTEDDIPAIYKGNVYKNYDLLTVSAPCCEPVLSAAMHLEPGIAQATGVSRTDNYFDEAYNNRCRTMFESMHPEAKGKKIILWAPTFRGNAGNPTLCGLDAIKRAMEQTEDEYYWLIKLHPHLEGKGMSSNCTMSCEELLCVADLLITDYSSVLFDYMAYRKPFVLFAPDFSEFSKTRGFYVDYDSYPTTVVMDEADLPAAIKYEMNHRDVKDIEECYKYHMASCDGHATERILERIGLV